MKPLRALTRHLDPWAALLLGLLVAMAVIILLATAGPLSRGAGKAPATAPPAQSGADIAAFLTTEGPRPQCEAAFWIHFDPSAPSLTVVLIPVQTVGFLPGGGYEPLAEIVADAGPSAGATALGGIVGVPLHLWFTGGLKALSDAFSSSFPGVLSPPAALRVRDSVLAWSAGVSPAARFARQYSFLKLALAESDFAGVNVVGFANYVLAAPGVGGNLNLQTAASLAATLRRLGDVPPTLCAVPAIDEVTRHSHSWRLESDPLINVRQSLVMGAPPPLYAARVTARKASPVVVVLLDPLGSAQTPYLAALGNRLRDMSGGPVRLVPLVVKAADDVTGRLAFVLDQTRPQAVLVALGMRTMQSDAAGLAARLSAVTALLGQRGQAAMLAAPAASGALAQVVAAAAKHAGLPLSPAATPPASSSAPVAQSRVQRLADAWAQAQVTTLARACDPTVFAPRLIGTLLGVSYYQRTKTTVLLAGVSIPARYPSLLASCGWRTSSGGLGAWTPLRVGAAVSYRPGAQRLARALAGDLGLPAASVVADPRAPASLVVSVS